MRSPLPFLLSLSLLVGLFACGTNTPENEPVSGNAVEEAARERPFGGIALYTLRDTMGKDPRGVLQAVADLGYAYIEGSGSIGRRDDRIRQLADVFVLIGTEVAGLIDGLTGNDGLVALTAGQQGGSNGGADGHACCICGVPQ